MRGKIPARESYLLFKEKAVNQESNKLVTRVLCGNCIGPICNPRGGRGLLCGDQPNPQNEMMMTYNELYQYIDQVMSQAFWAYVIHHSLLFDDEYDPVGNCQYNVIASGLENLRQEDARTLWLKHCDAIFNGFLFKKDALFLRNAELINTSLRCQNI